MRGILHIPFVARFLNLEGTLVQSYQLRSTTGSKVMNRLLNQAVAEVFGPKIPHLGKGVIRANGSVGILNPKYYEDLLQRIGAHLGRNVTTEEDERLKGNLWNKICDCHGYNGMVQKEPKPLKKKCRSKQYTPDDYHNLPDENAG